MIYGVVSGEVDSWWNHVEPYIEKALKHGLGEYAAEDIKKECKEKRMQLWVHASKESKGAFVTHIMKYPQMNVLLVLTLGGENFENWNEELNETLVGFGKEHGCKYIELFGRKGWGKAFLNGINYKEQGRVFVKEIV